MIFCCMKKIINLSLVVLLSLVLVSCSKSDDGSSEADVDTEASQTLDDGLEHAEEAPVDESEAAEEASH